MERYIQLKNELESKFQCKVRRKARDYFDDIIIEDIKRGTKTKIIVYIRNNFKQEMALRTDMDDTMIYFWFLAPIHKIEKVKKQKEIDKVRFKWLYEKVKEEETFIKHVKEEDK